MSQALATVNALTTPTRFLAAPPPRFSPVDGPAKLASPRKQYQRIRTFRLKTRTSRSKKRKPVVPTTKARRTLHRLTSHGILLGLAGIVIGSIFTYYGNTLSLKGNVMSRESPELVKWTVEKDFCEVCEAVKCEPSYIPACNDIFRAPLSPSPHVSSNRRTAQNTPMLGLHNRRAVRSISNSVHPDDIGAQSLLKLVSLVKAASIAIAFGMLRICWRRWHEIPRKAAQRGRKLHRRAQLALELSLLGSLHTTVALFHVVAVLFHTIPFLFVGMLKRCVTISLLAILAIPLLFLCGSVYFSFLVLEVIAECFVVRPMMSKAQEKDAVATARLTMLFRGIVIALRMCFALPWALMQALLEKVEDRLMKDRGVKDRRVEDRMVERQSAVFAREFVAKELAALVKASGNTFRYGEPFCWGF